MTKKYVIILLLLIGIAPVSSTIIENQETDLSIKAKGTDDSVKNETINSNESYSESSENITEEIENEIIKNDSIESMDTHGIVMQSRTYSCGPAALATVLRDMGIETNEEELINLSGTDENGTSMYGLIQAAKSKGMDAVGKKLTTNQLKKGDIVFIMVEGSPHYSVINNITNETVHLADPSLGHIEMSIEDFNDAFTGNTIILKNNFSDSIPINDLIINSTENEQPTDNIGIQKLTLESDASNSISFEEMQNIIGKFYQIPLTLVGIGEIIITVRNKYVPKKYHKYIAYHPSNKRVKAYIGKDHKIHYKEY